MITGASMEYEFCLLPEKADKFEYTLDIDVQTPADDVFMCMTLLDEKGNPIGSYNSRQFKLPMGKQKLNVSLPLPKLLPGIYGVRPILYKVCMREIDVYDQPLNYARFEVVEDVSLMNMRYIHSMHGNMVLGESAISLLNA